MQHEKSEKVKGQENMKIERNSDALKECSTKNVQYEENMKSERNSEI